MQHSVLQTGALSALLPLALAGALPASAAEVRPGDRVVVGANETIDDDLYAFGGTVTVLGRVNGDVIAAGGTITIAGPVAGDVSAAGGTIQVSGDVKGSVRGRFDHHQRPGRGRR